MIEIELTQGFKTIIDDIDYEKVKRFKWRIHKTKHHRYARTSLWNKGKQIHLYMHQLIMGQKSNLITDHIDRRHYLLTDHIDGNGLNNCRNNLRMVTHIQSTANSRKSQKNNCKSNYKGISFMPSLKKWRAVVRTKNEYHYLGLFNHEIEAAIAYNDKAKEIFGEFAKINQIDPSYFIGANL